MTILVAIVASLFLQMFDPSSGDPGKRRPPIKDGPVAETSVAGL